jgi:hypothetical protein
VPGIRLTANHRESDLYVHLLNFATEDDCMDPGFTLPLLRDIPLTLHLPEGCSRVEIAESGKQLTAIFTESAGRWHITIPELKYHTALRFVDGYRRNRARLEDRL